MELENGQNVGFKDGRAYGLSLDYAPARDAEVKLEVLWSRQDSGFNLEGAAGVSHVRMSIDEFQVGGVLEISQGRFHEYMTGLMGASLFSPSGFDSDVHFSVSLGGGVKFFLFRNVALRADLRGYCTLVDSDSAFISSGGLTIIHFSGDTLWQGEITGGITIAF